jgi:hypothetical protein
MWFEAEYRDSGLLLSTQWRANYQYYLLLPLYQHLCGQNRSGRATLSVVLIWQSRIGQGGIDVARGHLKDDCSHCTTAGSFRLLRALLLHDTAEALLDAIPVMKE